MIRSSRYRALVLCALSSLALVGSGPSAARAGLALSFDSPTYTTPEGLATTVSVYLSQVDGGPQVGVGNELLSAGIALSYTTAGAPAVTTLGGSNPGPAWDLGLVSQATVGPLTVFNVTLLSLAGIADLSSPLLLATFTFTGVSPGSMSLAVADFDPGTVDFITAGGDILDPTDAAGARLTVTPAAVAAPEPSSLVLMALAASALVPVGRRFRARPGPRAD